MYDILIPIKETYQNTKTNRYWYGIFVAKRTDHYWNSYCTKDDKNKGIHNATHYTG
tara:strand:+ start:704 stop:871 length:168 start_codon:yes stop_codon:yes gene_type:complete